MDNRQDQITVWGYRHKFSPAPMARSQLLEPGSQSGIVHFENGAIHDVISNGISLGLAIPVPGVKGLDFTASLAATRDSLSPTGTTAAAAAIAGLRLKF